MFKKGMSGNPGGRPKSEKSLTSILRSLGDIEDVAYNGDMISRKQAVAEAIWQKAIADKDMAAIKYLYDRIDGLPVAKQEIGGMDGEPVKISIEYVDKA